MEIFDTNDSFEFEKLVLTKPTSIPGGNYFIKFLINSQPLYIQPPKCKTRQGVVKAGKRFYSDLMFTNENEDFIRWMENLENYCQQYIYKNREKWFEGEMELHDIENYFTSPLKLFKSGKYYIARTNITTVLGKPTLKIYDENEKEIDFENINDDTNVMTILEIQGIKCSAKSFQIEVELKQMMVLQPTDIFERCIIKSTGVIPQQSTSENISSLPKHYETIEVFSCDIPLRSERGLSQENKEDNDENKMKFSEDSIEDKITNENSNKDVVELIEESNEYIIKCSEDNEDKIKEEGLENIDPLLIQEPIKESIGEESLEEVEFHLEDLNDSETIVIKNRNNVYYEMYKEARKKAKIARDLALSTYLEAKRIKNTYMLENLDDESDDENESEGDEDENEDDSDEEDENNNEDN